MGDTFDVHLRSCEKRNCETGIKAPLVYSSFKPVLPPRVLPTLPLKALESQAGRRRPPDIPSKQIKLPQGPAGEQGLTFSTEIAETNKITSIAVLFFHFWAPLQFKILPRKQQKNKRCTS